MNTFPIPSSGGPGGGATEATALAILAELEKQAVFSETIWVDATGTFFIRRVVYSENLETYTVEYTLANGSTYSPTLPIEPASAGTDRELVATSYTVLVSGTGYSVGDIVQQVNIFDTSAGTLLSTIWYNQTTDLTISPAPDITDLQPEGSIQSIASATGNQTDVAYTTGNGTIISLLKGLFGKLGTLGQKNMAGSAPVVIASDQSTLPVSAASLPLPAGAATETTLAAVLVDTGDISTYSAATLTEVGEINTNTGSVVDPAYTSGNGSVISILKGIFGRLTRDPIAPSTTQTTTNFYVAAAVTQDQNSTATATTPSTGGRWIQATNNSGVICDITVGGTGGANDGTALVTLIAGAVISLPMAIAASAVLRIKPRSAALTSSDVVSVVVT